MLFYYLVISFKRKINGLYYYFYLFSFIFEVCDKDKAAISRVIANMEKKGLVTRKGKNNTVYRALLFLTDEGKKAAGYVTERAKIAVEKAGSGLSDHDRQIFYSSLGLISSNLQKICKDGLPESC